MRPTSFLLVLFAALLLQLLDVAVVVDLLVLVVALEQQLVPLFALYPGCVHCTAVDRRQTLLRDVLVQRLAIGAVEDDTIAQLLAQDRLKQCEHHVEDFWLIDNVYALDAQRHCVLQPVYDSLRKRWRKLPRLLERQPVHVEDYDRPVHLRFGLEHCRLEEQDAALEHLVQGDFLVLPGFAQLQQQHTPSELIPVREHGQNVLLEDVGLLRGHQLVVHVEVFYLELVVPLDLQTGGRFALR